MKKAIFWDFDGTLVKSNTSFFESLKDALWTYGYSINEKLIKDFLGGACSWNMPQIAYTDAVGEMWWQNLLPKVKEFCIENYVKQDHLDPVCDEFRKNVVGYAYELYADAEEALAHSKALGYENYLLSNNFPELIETVERFGLKRYFVGYNLSADIGYEKPRREIFEYALHAAGNPQVCYMVGDNPIADIAGAQAAGICTIMVHRNPIDSVKPDYWCSELSEIAKIIGE